MPPENWSSINESIIDEIGILLPLNIGDCTHEKAFQWFTTKSLSNHKFRADESRIRNVVSKGL